MIFFLWLGCVESVLETPQQRPTITTETRAENTDPKQQGGNLDQGQKHPPIPENNPVWEWNAEGFVPDHGWYGEHSWGDVRMRALGHLSIAGRDYARMAAENHDLKEAAQRYKLLVEHLSSVPIPDSDHANEVATILLESARRDEDLLRSLSEGKAPIGPGNGLAELRRQYFEIALDPAPEKIDVISLQSQLDAFLTPDPSLAIDGFEDFVSRHELRTRLFVHYSESLDPLSISERWGYWTNSEQIRQALCIGWALGKLGGESWNSKLREFQEAPLVEPETAQTPAIYWPSLMAEKLNSPDMQTDFSHREFAWLPTGDSLIDVAGQPGPMAIGTLMKLGVGDSEYRTWLEPKLERLKQTFVSSGDVVAQLKDILNDLENTYQHGSLFYTHKQIRNATVRQLARSNLYSDAFEVHQLNFPLHHQDWACPNREGLLKAIGGRLLAEANDPRAEAEIKASIESTLLFLEQVSQAEKGLIKGPKPPHLNLQAPQGRRPAGHHKQKGNGTQPRPAGTPQ